MTASQLVCGALYIVTGVLHFVIPKFYLAMMPRLIPREQHKMLVYVSGVAEIAGGAGVLITSLRTYAGIGLIALLIAVFPANVQMLMNAQRKKAPASTLAGLWFRLPIQAVLIWWVWVATLA